MSTLITVSVFVLGAIAGSFVNALSFRLNTGKSMLGRSQCMSCSAVIKWYDLIPIASYIVLKGKCRMCRSRFSFQYPVIELFLGVLFASVYYIYGTSISSIIILISLVLLVAIVIYDMRHLIIPDTLVYPLIALSVLSLFIRGLNLSNILAGVILFSFFAVLWIVSKGKWMGFGDAKLALAIGWLLGMAGALSALILSFWLGAVVSIFLLFLRKGKMTFKSEVPFAPYLVLGFLMELFFHFNVLGI